ncbi:DoxX family protein [Sphingobacterium hungaricum]|uniref:DoxX family membrane protein n=1 Tax=Sphingobacterium hungaricum TaxID=2082723 RepID=A0A928YRZ6_9SPHI|nr:hypothetical protein [Sphingobacterium hungaricum]MBE8715212.1 hypothetical protein [Sphingobacterium hungaricum]
MRTTSTAQNLTRIGLALFMVFAGMGHLSFLRDDFQAQVPVWLPIDKDFVVLASGFVEITLGLLLLFYTKKRREIGIALAIFYVLIFPGNINQYVEGIDAFGLDNDRIRLIRLFFQPVLIFLALWSTGFWNKKRR